MREVAMSFLFWDYTFSHTSFITPLGRSCSRSLQKEDDIAVDDNAEDSNNDASLENID